MDRIMRKIYNFFEFFIPFFYMVGGFVLIVKGCEIIEELSGVSQYIVGISIMLMSFGVIGKYYQSIGMDEEIEKDKRKRLKMKRKGVK